jgi:hypothetical protein
MDGQRGNTGHQNNATRPPSQCGVCNGHAQGQEAPGAGETPVVALCQGPPNSAAAQRGGARAPRQGCTAEKSRHITNDEGAGRADRACQQDRPENVGFTRTRAPSVLRSTSAQSSHPPICDIITSKDIHPKQQQVLWASDAEKRAVPVQPPACRFQPRVACARTHRCGQPHHDCPHQCCQSRNCEGWWARGTAAVEQFMSPLKD